MFSLFNQSLRWCYRWCYSQSGLGRGLGGQVLGLGLEGCGLDSKSGVTPSLSPSPFLTR